MDEAEIAAFTDLVHAFLLYRPRVRSTSWSAGA
jgi:hypothetical protein